MESCFEDTYTIDENYYLESILRLLNLLNVEKVLIWRLEVLRPYLSDSNTPENFNVLKLQCVQEVPGLLPILWSVLVLLRHSSFISFCHSSNSIMH